MFQHGDFKSIVEIPLCIDIDLNLHILVDSSLSIEYYIIHQDTTNVVDSG